MKGVRVGAFIFGLFFALLQGAAVILHLTAVGPSYHVTDATPAALLAHYGDPLLAASRELAGLSWLAFFPLLGGLWLLLRGRSRGLVTFGAITGCVAGFLMMLSDGFTGAIASMGAQAGFGHPDPLYLPQLLVTLNTLSQLTMFPSLPFFLLGNLFLGIAMLRVSVPFRVAGSLFLLVALTLLVSGVMWPLSAEAADTMIAVHKLVVVAAYLAAAVAALRFRGLQAA